jgi:Fic family protein
MRRGRTGEYVIISTVGGERVRAFVPFPLPPVPPLSIDDALRERLDRALVALGRLDSVTTILPDPALFLYTYVRKEAVLSSQIEGTQSSLSDLLLFELEELPGVPTDDAAEASRYVAAMEHGLRRMRHGFPLSGRLLREVHEVLVRGGRGAERLPGEFRQSQNWIGGSRPGTAIFVPPPADRLGECIGGLERWLHGEPQRAPALIRAALGHVQFETIHPFLDGNGRIGRLLVTLLLVGEGLLHEPLLYVSLYLKQHRKAYYDLLQRVRLEGEWEEWLGFFADGVRETAEGAIGTVRRVTGLFQRDAERIRGLPRVSGSALRIHHELTRRPLATAPRLARNTKLSLGTVLATLERLMEVGMVREITGRRRNRVFSYDRYVRILNEGTRPL